MSDLRKTAAVALAASLVLALAVAVTTGIRLEPVPLVLACLCFAVLAAVPAVALAGGLPAGAATAASWAAAVAAGGLYLLQLNPWVGVIGDNIVYLRDAMDLAAGKPAAGLTFGVAITAALIPAVAWCSEQVVAAKATVALLAVLLPAGTFLVLRRHTTPERALLIAALTAVVPITVEYAADIMADVPHAGFNLLALWALQRYLDGPERSWPHLVVASVAMGLAFHIKSAAVVIPVAAALYSLLRGQWQRALWIMAGFLLWVLPWNLLQSAQGGKGGYIAMMVEQISRGEHMPDDQIGGFWHNLVYLIAIKNPVDYVVNLGGLLVGTQTIIEAGAVLVLLLSGAIAGRPRCDGSLLGWLRAPEVHDWFVLGYLALLFTLPGSPPRYLIALLPFLLLYVCRGADWLAGLTRQRVIQRAAVPVLAGVIGISCWVHDLNRVAFLRHQNGYPGYWGGYYQAALWLKEHTPAESRVATRKPTLVWFWSGRPSEVYPWTADTQAGWEKLRDNFDYAIVDNLPFFQETRKFLIPMLESHRGQWDVVFVTPPPENYVVRLRRD
jgi:hypothetical protein